MSAGGAAGSQTAALEFGCLHTLFHLPSLQALEAVGRLRCSRGLAVEKYIGSFYRWGGRGRWGKGVAFDWTRRIV